MSEQELIKWKNKFKLYMVLHPNEYTPHCRICKYKKRDCSKIETLMYNKYTDKAKYSLEVQQNGNMCIEWIIP